MIIPTMDGLKEVGSCSNKELVDALISSARLSGELTNTVCGPSRSNKEVGVIRAELISRLGKGKSLRPVSDT